MRKSRLPVVVVCVGLLGAVPALAGEPPAYVPQRDVTIEYVVTPAGRPQEHARVSAEAGAAHIRIDSDSVPGPVVLDRAAGTALIIYPPAKMFTELPGQRLDVERLLDDAHPQFTAIGHSVVAGYACTDYRIVARDGSGTGCLTADGVLLRGSGQDRHGRGGAVSAVSVRYAALPASAFAPPPGYAELPRGMLSALIPGLGRAE